MLYTVCVKEVWNAYVRIEADSAAEAIAFVAEGEGEIQDNLFEYNYTLDTDQWEVEEEKPD